MKGLLVVLGIALGGLWTAGAIGFAQIELNFFNVLILPVLLGTSVDAAIHYCHRSLQSENPIRAAQETGQALLLCISTTFFGFGALILARSNAALASMGAIAMIGTALSFCASMLVLPAVLLQWQHLRAKQGEARPAPAPAGLMDPGPDRPARPGNA